MDGKNASICSFCSRMKRGILYTVCKREGYSVLALGQHLDDQAESLLMSAFHNGQLRTMKAHYRAKDHDVRVARPLTYAREALTREYAEAAGLPVITDNCPGCFEAPKVERCGGLVHVFVLCRVVLWCVVLLCVCVLCYVSL